jgi:hypothetical protein
MRNNKSFDCVEMKRRIQEKLYNDTCHMNDKETIAYFHKKIAESRFASFLQRPGHTLVMPKKTAG